MRNLFTVSMILCACACQAAWTNAWYSGWTNSGPGWMAYRYAKDIDRATIERYNVSGLGNRTNASLWATGKWLAQIDGAIKNMTPKFMDTRRRVGGTYDSWFSTNTTIPMWTFSNACVYVGLTNGTFSRSRLTTNAPLWPRRRDLDERRDVLRVLSMTTNRASEVWRANYKANLGPLFSTNLNIQYTWSNIEDIWPDMETLSSNAWAVTAITTNQSVSGSLLAGYASQRGYVYNQRSGATNYPDLVGTHAFKQYARNQSYAMATNYAANVSAYIHVTTNRESLSTRRVEGPTLYPFSWQVQSDSGAGFTAEYTTNFWEYGVYYSMDNTITRYDGDGNIPADGTGYKQYSVAYRTGAVSVVHSGWVGDTNLSAALRLPSAFPVAQSSNQASLAREGWQIGFANSGAFRVLYPIEIEKRVLWFSDWYVTNGFRYQ